MKTYPIKQSFLTYIKHYFIFWALWGSFPRSDERSIKWNYLAFSCLVDVVNRNWNVSRAVYQSVLLKMVAPTVCLWFLCVGGGVPNHKICMNCVQKYWGFRKMIFQGDWVIKYGSLFTPPPPQTGSRATYEQGYMLKQLNAAFFWIKENSSVFLGGGDTCGNGRGKHKDSFWAAFSSYFSRWVGKWLEKPSKSK